MSGVNFPGNTYADAGAVKGWSYLDGSTYILDDSPPTSTEAMWLLG